MANHPNRTPTARTAAKKSGYFIREGEFQGATDNRLGRWYVGHADSESFRPFGAGHATQKAAWEAAFEHARENGRM
jgi:hypothetical protein